MWLCDSSVGRKVVMSISGIALILFLTFHASMNVVALISAKGYNMICEFLGANRYAVVATLGLAALVALHFIYAIWLTLQNRKARGTNRYAVTDKPEKVEWASQNMFVLGLIVILGMALHLYNFWWNMMAAELLHVEGLAHHPADGYAWIVETFSCPVFTGLYLVWLAALWFHLTHGFWSAMQTMGWSGKVWFCRWKVIGIAYSTILVLMFAVVAVAFSCGWQACDAKCCEAAQLECPLMHCEKACEAKCEKPCEAKCEKACEAKCEKPCEAKCEKACEAKCEKPCEAKCEKAAQAECPMVCDHQDCPDAGCAECPKHKPCAE